jgi:hypothetical protein
MPSRVTARPITCLGKIRPVVLGMAVLTEIILFFSLEIGGGGIEIQEIYFQVEQVSHAEEDIFLNGLVGLKQKILMSQQRMNSRGQEISGIHRLQ